MFKIVPIDPKQMTWRVLADGTEIRPRLLQVDSDYGSFNLGLRPEGFHGWAFKPGKGGVMTLLWSKTPEGEILVGVIHENRPNWGTTGVWSAPGGFVDSAETKEISARRELLEEGGLDTRETRELPGGQVNPDRMYYVMEDGDDWGMHMFEHEVPFNLLDQADEQIWRPKKDVISHKKESDIVFMPWREVVLRSADALTLSGIARLLRTLL